jgi:hypothetical protein
MQKLAISTVIVLAAALALFCAGCGQGDFNYGKVGHLVEGAPIHLDAEYVILNQGQVDCGVQEDLWDQPPPMKGIPGEHAVARLTDKGRALKFSDDVTLGEMRQPFAQVRGDFNLQAIDIQSDRDGPDPGTKLVNIQIGVKIDHTCFPNPVLMMGVRKGNFTQDQVPVLKFRFDNGWEFEKFVH